MLARRASVHILLGLQLVSSALAQTPGMLDTNFPVGAGSDTRFWPVVVQNDGKVLIGGNFTSPTGVSRTNVIRLNADGTLDTNFNYFGGAPASTYAVQSDGKVIVGRVAFPMYFVERLHPNGSLDHGYTNRLSGSGLRDVVIQPADGKAVIAGSFTSVNGTNRNHLARLNTDGRLDLSLQDWFPSFAVANVWALALQADGKILIGGDFDKTTNPARTNIARLNSDGTVDNTFHPVVDFSGASHLTSVEDLVVQPDGKILISGQFTSVNGVARRHIARLNANGTLDTTFQANVTSVLNNQGVFSVVLEDQGHILLGGYFTEVNGLPRPHIARLNPNGRLDPSFVVGAGPNEPVYQMASQPNGGLLVRGDFTSINGVARPGFARLHAGLIRYSLDEPIPLPPGRSISDVTNATVVPPNRAYWEPLTKTLYPTTVGDVTITWQFATAPHDVTIIGTIIPLSTDLFDIGQEVPPPAGADTNQEPLADGGGFWHPYTHKLYVTAPGPRTITWKRSNNTTFPQQIMGQWPTNPAIYQIHVANSAPVDVTGGGRYGFPMFFSQDPGTGASLVNNQFTASSPGRSVYLVSASAGAPAQSTNIFFQLVQTVAWNDPDHLRDTNIAVIGEAVDDPAHNSACGSPYVLDYPGLASPGRFCADPFFYDRANRTGPIIPVNRSASGTRTDDLLLALYQLGAKLSDPLTDDLLTNTVCWPYAPARYLSVWPPNPEKLFIAGGQGSGPVTLPDPNWSVYRQPNTSEYGYNPNEEHAFRFQAGPPVLQLKLSASATMVVQGGFVPLLISLVGDPVYAPLSPVTVTISGARGGDSNLFVIFPANGTPEQLVFAPTNWTASQTVYFATSNNIGSGSNSFVVRATGGLASQATVEVYQANTNQLGLVIDALAFEVAENGSRAVDIRLTRPPPSPVTVTIVNRGTPADSPVLRVESGAVLMFNAGNWNVPQPVSIRADADAGSGNDTAVFQVQASGGLTALRSFTATQVDTTAAADAVYALRNDLGDAFGATSSQSSEPYVLLSHTNAAGQGQIKVYKVLAEDATHRFLSHQKAGQLLQPPNPLTILPKCLNTVAVAGPYFRDKNSDHWAKAAGFSNGLPAGTNIILHYFYKPFPTVNANGFDAPLGSGPYSGQECLPWLDQYAMTPGIPVDYTFSITWPDHVPELRVGETLVKPKFGLPNIANQCSVDVVYEQTGPATLVQLYEPLALRVFPANNLPNGQLPPEIVTQIDPIDQKLVFMEAPLTLRKRLKFNPNAVPPQFEFGGTYNDTDYVGEPLLLPNVMTMAEASVMKALSANPAYRAAIDALRAITVASITGVSSLGSQFKALSAASPLGQGYVALAMQNSANCGSAPISIEIFKVTCPLYRGDIKALYADCAFDETLTLRHSADFAGRGDDYQYAWFYRKVGTTTWIQDASQIHQDLTIKGPGLRTLEDYEYYCHYQPLSGANLCGPGLSPDTLPQLAEGWIKRVLRGVNPFTQLTTDFRAGGVDTTANMIAQAGARWEGSIALNCMPGNQFGLIEAYETVLRRGIDLSIGAGFALTDDTALRLAAGQLSDLYLLLGNEAYGDAQDPTIGFGTEGGQFTASSIFCFQGQAGSLLQEELILLRGRDGPYGNDNSPGTRVDVAPAYNRLYWNFGPDQAGQTAYVLNYGVSDRDASGTINATDGRSLFPMGHGDAWGHYLSAIKSYYRLFSDPNYTWVPEIENVNINGANVQVNYQHERKFAKVAAARARTGAEIVNLTYRSLYVEDPAAQWQGYHDANTNRAWGVTEWASRAGQAALFDWLAGNTLLPAQDLFSPPLAKADRTTVSELRELAASFLDIQQSMDTADQGLNPLGLNKNVVPFGIDPGQLTSGQTHFDQIYGRAVGAMNNAIAVFNHANEPTQLLRRQQDSLLEFQRNVVERSQDFTNRLIEIFGYPYNEDIGGSGAYPVGYVGPDIHHFSYVDVRQLAGIEPPTTQTISLNMQELRAGPDGTLSTASRPVTFNFSSENRALVKPANFTSRLAPGEIQRALGDLLQARVRLDQALVTYDNLIAQIEDQAQHIEAQYALDAAEIRITSFAAARQKSLNDLIQLDQAIQSSFRTAARTATLVADAYAEFLPTAAGFTVDPTSTARGVIRLAGAVLSESYNQTADHRSQVELGHQQAKEEAQNASNLHLTTIRQEAGLLGQIAQLQQLVRQEAVMRYDLYNLREGVTQASGNYLATLARGYRILEDRTRFLQQTAAQVQAYRYKDMAFRIFRNDALQKYRAQFDLAARYVYLAAKAYDYETGLLQTSSRAGSAFLEDIVKKRAIGTIQNGVPLPGTTGDSGLAAPMAAMGQNYATIKANLGLNNQITRQRLFSLRNGWFRISNSSSNSVVWRETLRRALVNNIWDIPEYQRYCRPLRAEPFNGHEPALVIRFPSEIIAENNFFGWPAGGGDSAYNASLYSTKIISVGIWLSSYDSSANGLVQFPSAWLVPVGEDVVRAAGANDFSYRHWKVYDQKIPTPNDFLGSPPNFNLNWIPIHHSLNGEFGAVGGQRQYNSLEATTESQAIPLDTAHLLTDSGLVGRSVWNTQWMLIIPGVALLGSNPDEGLERFIAGSLVGGQRTGNGVTDVKLYFQTYSYSGF